MHRPGLGPTERKGSERKGSSNGDEKVADDAKLCTHEYKRSGRKGPTERKNDDDEKVGAMQDCASTKNSWPVNLIETIKIILKEPCVKPAKSEFKFTLDRESAAKNLCIMKKYKNDLGKAIEAQSKSPLGYGSEFRPTNILEGVFKKHPNWTRIKSILEEDSS